MKCKFCGKKFGGNKKICPYCGKDLKGQDKNSKEEQSEKNTDTQTQKNKNKEEQSEKISDVKTQESENKEEQSDKNTDTQTQENKNKEEQEKKFNIPEQKYNDHAGNSNKTEENKSDKDTINWFQKSKTLWIILFAFMAFIIVSIPTADALLLTHTVCVHEWNEADCENPKTCIICNKKVGEALGHKFTKATCTEDSVCQRCGKIGKKATGHRWSKRTYIAASVCLNCGKEGKPALGHNWLAANCQRPETCSRCGETRGKLGPHSWVKADCTHPKTCSICKKTEGKSLGHDWAKATCVDPKRCRRCGKTEGKALGHDWIAATLSKPKTCTRCGETEGSALDYSYDDNYYVLTDFDSGLSLHSLKDEDSYVRAVAPYGAEVKAYETGDSDWSYIVYDGNEGYVKREYLSSERVSKTTFSNSTWIESALDHDLSFKMNGLYMGADGLLQAKFTVRNNKSQSVNQTIDFELNGYDSWTSQSISLSPNEIKDITVTATCDYDYLSEIDEFKINFITYTNDFPDDDWVNWTWDWD